jgi:hypothetical protein
MLSPESAWACSEYTTKHSGKLALTIEAALLGDLRDRKTVFKKQRLCCIDPTMDQVAIGREAGGVTEGAAEVEAAASGHRCKILKLYVGSKVRIDEFENTPKTPRRHRMWGKAASSR